MWGGECGGRGRAGAGGKGGRDGGRRESGWHDQMLGQAATCTQSTHLPLPGCLAAAALVLETPKPQGAGPQHSQGEAGRGAEPV